MEANTPDTPAVQQSACPITSQTVDVQAIRAKFPAFTEKPGTIFFDNASTTQKPQAVVELIDRFYRRECANAGRGSYQMSTTLTTRIEEARARVAAFIGAAKDDVCFTSGATESLNTVALAWGLKNLKTGDEVMVCLEDHKSTVLPWFNLQRLLKSFGVEIKIVPFRLHPEGDYELKSIREAKTEKTRLVAITHIHHLYGLDMEVKEIREAVGNDVLISLDASQSVGHRKVNLQELPVEFLSFSGHKMFAANGVGVLWVSPKVRTTLMPVMVGGGMVPEGELADLKLSGTTLASLLESGTQNIPAVLSLVPAIEFIESISIDAIESRLGKLTRHLYAALKDLAGIDFSPGVDRCGCHRGFGIVSFRFEQASTSDLAFVLDSENILVRTGDHCLSSKQAGDDYVRVSLHVYNTEDEIDRLVGTLRANLQ